MRRPSGFLYLLCGLMIAAGLVAAQRTVQAAGNTDTSGAAIQSYNADSSVLPGMIVELKPKTSNTVTPLTAQDLAHMVGIVVPTSAATLVLTPQSPSAQQVLVASSGRYNLLVSNQNGAVKSGDYLTISALAGIGMKADVSQPEVVAQAAADFDGSNNVLGTMSVTNGQGHTSTVAIGSIAVTVRLASNPLYQKNTDGLPGFLSKISNNATGHPAHSARLGLAAVVLGGSFFMTATIFYGGVYSSLVAIGRNPLAKKSIDRKLLQAILTGLIIFVLGVAATYLILTL